VPSDKRFRVIDEAWLPTQLQGRIKSANLKKEKQFAASCATIQAYIVACRDCAK
jgi:hypothetical protein